MIKKISFKNISLLFVLIPMLLLSVFAFIPTNKDLGVYADESISSYNFQGSNLVTTCTPMYNGRNGTIQSWHFLTFRCGISYDGSTLSYSFTGNSMGRATSTNFGNPHPFNGNGSIVGYGSIASPTYSFEAPGYATFTDATSYGVRYSVLINGFFNGNVTRIFLGNDLGSDSNGSYIVNKAIYYCDNGASIGFWIYSYYTGSNNSLNTIFTFAFDNRDYYLGVDLSNNGYYQAGYTDGYNSGVSVGTNSGYTDGYNSGYDVGYNVGYVDGESHGSDYTFMSLIGSVIDVPVNAFTSLLNFEILGINVLAFVTGLLTLAIIIFIVKLCLGGK